METRQAHILLTRLNGRFGRFIYLCTGRRYTHASIRLEGMGESFFSFNLRGLCLEKPAFFSRKRIAKSVMYQIDLPVEIYEELKTRLEAFLEHRSKYRYSRLGLCLCLLHIPHRFPDAFFCSQFVAELLVQAGVIELSRSVSVCTPNHLEQAICRSTLLRSMVADPTMC